MNTFILSLLFAQPASLPTGGQPCTPIPGDAPGAVVDLNAPGACLSIAEKGLFFGPFTLQGVAARLGDCGPLQLREGGNVIECTSGVSLVQRIRGQELRVGPRPTKPLAGTACNVYVQPGGQVYTERQARVMSSVGKAIDVEPGVTYCADTRILDATLTPADVTTKLGYNTCQTETLRGGTHVTCPYDGIKLSFAGPPGRLSRIETVPVTSPR